MTFYGSYFCINKLKLLKLVTANNIKQNLLLKMKKEGGSSGSGASDSDDEKLHEHWQLSDEEFMKRVPKEYKDKPLHVLRMWSDQGVFDVVIEV